MNRSPAYWPTRIMLAVGILATAVAALGALYLMAARGSSDSATVLGLPADVIVPAVALGFVVFGLVWMVRIVRGPGDQPSDWRYRDR